MTYFFEKHALLRIASGRQVSKLSQRVFQRLSLVIVSLLAIEPHAAFGAGYSPAIRCQTAISSAQKGTVYELTPITSDFRLEYTRSLVTPDTTTWTPGTEISKETGSGRVICHHNFTNYSGRPMIYLKIAPDQIYLDPLRENGIDVEIQVDAGGAIQPVRLMEDNVSVRGRHVPLPSFQTVKWDPQSRVYQLPVNQQDSVPWVVVTLRYVLRESESRKKYLNSRHEIDFPDADRLRLFIYADEYEWDGVPIAAQRWKGPISFGTCAAPLISIDRTGRASANIDFGFVGLDTLKNADAPLIVGRSSIPVVLKAFYQ